MIPTLPFGRTGHTSTRTIFGAAALGSVSQADADRALELLLYHGINHIDTAASYGEAELRIGPWMARHRGDFFLATKTGERTHPKAREQIERSLDRLRTDRLDLVQMHCLIDEADWQTAMGPGGALEALVEARDRGLVRHIGVTGHELRAPAMHRRSLERFGFDSVLLPYNFALAENPSYVADFDALVGVCAARGVAVQTIKAIAKGHKPDGGDRYTTWYAPLSEREAIDAAVHWVLGRPGVFLNTAGDLTLLPMILDAAERFVSRPADGRMREQARSLGIQPLFG